MVKNYPATLLVGSSGQILKNHLPQVILTINFATDKGLKKWVLWSRAYNILHQFGGITRLQSHLSNTVGQISSFSAPAIYSAFPPRATCLFHFIKGLLLLLRTLPCEQLFNVAFGIRVDTTVTFHNNDLIKSLGANLACWTQYWTCFVYIKGTSGIFFPLWNKFATLRSIKGQLWKSVAKYQKMKKKKMYHGYNWHHWALHGMLLFTSVSVTF